MKVKTVSSSKLHSKVGCKDCGWPVIECCCNNEMSSGEWGSWDWWMYCSNKGCKNHKGEGIFQDKPDWTFREE